MFSFSVTSFCVVYLCLPEGIFDNLGSDILVSFKSSPFLPIKILKDLKTVTLH